MAHAIIVDSHGDAEKLKYAQVTDSKPNSGEVRLKHTAIGVNFIDVYHRTGLYGTNVPFIPGVEACGIVEEVGPNVGGLQVGDRVAYGTAINAQGAYSTHRNIDANLLIKVPADISDEVAAAIMVKGMTAHYLIRRTYVVGPGANILVHAAAGGVGTYLCQWASYSGCNVIGTVSTAEKAKWASENGCAYPLNVKSEDWPEQVKAITGGLGVGVVYDSIGKDTFLRSFDCLMPLGLMVSYGQSSGPVPPFDLSVLAKGNFFLTRPTLGFYKGDRNELILSGMELFEAVRLGAIAPKITQKIPLKDAAEAHRLLESRQTMGSIILVP